MKKTIELIDAWERGEASPTYVQLEELAYDIYKRPIAIFFFPEPPEEEPLEKTFRTLPDYELNRLPPRIVYLLRKAKALQFNLVELYGENCYTSRNILRDCNLDIHQDINSATEQIRSYIGISLDEQTQWSNTDHAMKLWRNSLEECGIFVFKDSFNSPGKTSEEIPYSGFSIFDEKFPIIYINNNNAKSRQIFTLFHELSHLLMQTGGIDTDNEDYWNHLTGDNRELEIRCNKFASLFLVPHSDFQEKTRYESISEASVSKLADHYCVSREVILRRFLEQGRVSQDEYKLQAAKWTEEWSEQKRKRVGGNYYSNIRSYLGDRYIETVFSHYYQGKISLEIAAEYLEQKPKNVFELDLKGSWNGKTGDSELVRSKIL